MFNVYGGTVPFKSLEARRKYLAEWRVRNRGRTLTVKRAYREKNRDRIRDYKREHGASHSAREAASKRHARYYSTKKQEPAYMAARRERARAWYAANAEWWGGRKQAMPKWANKFFISEIYHLAKLRTKHLGVPHEVDHVIPLRGRNVCGLHVENNLRVVPKAINRAKGNALLAQ